MIRQSRMMALWLSEHWVVCQTQSLIWSLIDSIRRKVSGKIIELKKIREDLRPLFGVAKMLNRGSSRVRNFSCHPRAIKLFREMSLKAHLYQCECPVEQSNKLHLPKTLSSGSFGLNQVWQRWEVGIHATQSSKRMNMLTLFELIVGLQVRGLQLLSPRI
jgi:hypothetical protein